MAVVWRAYDPSLDREVAIKEPRISEGADAELKKAYIERFIREARAVARLSHPSIVTVHAADTYDGRTAMIMELVDCELLSQAIRRGAVTRRLAISIIDQLLDAVAYAHERGVIHRDLKPANIFLTPNGTIKLADFGVAHIDSTQTLTIEGTILGTPAYMSPEQIKGLPTDARSDIFSVGVIAYELLTGSNPFQGSPDTNVATVLYRITNADTDPPASRDPSIPVHLSDTVSKALAKEPDERFSSAAEMRHAWSGAGQVADVGFPETSVPVAPEVIRGEGASRDDMLETIVDPLQDGSHAETVFDLPERDAAEEAVLPGFVDVERTVEGDETACPDVVSGEREAIEVEVSRQGEPSEPPPEIPAEERDTLPFPKPAKRRSRRVFAGLAVAALLVVAGIVAVAILIDNEPEVASEPDDSIQGASTPSSWPTTGEIRDAQDPLDVMTVDLAEGTTARFSMTAPEGASFGLVLYDPSVKALPASAVASVSPDSSTALEYEIPISGPYSLAVVRSAGQGRYSVDKSVSEPDDELSGAKTPRTWPVKGAIRDDQDPRDLVRVRLEKGAAAVFTLNGPQDASYRLALYAPSAGSDLAKPLAVSRGNSWPQTLSHAVGSGGTYPLAVVRDSGAGEYTVSRAITNPTTLSFAISDSRVPRGISTRLTARLVTVHNKPLSGKTVRFEMSKDQKKWTLLKAVKTASNGTASHEWRPGAAGGYHVRARFLGAGNLKQSTSTRRRIQVHEVGKTDPDSGGIEGHP